jgi:mRNA-degrading endonuclease YafQ of YafQ-DinJ toxin-antitoxin module
MARKIVVHASQRFDKDFANLPDAIQVLVIKALALFVDNPRHPGLQVRKMKGHKGIWEARVTQDYRFTFTITEDSYLLRRVGPHDIERNP